MTRMKKRDRMITLVLASVLSLSVLSVTAFAEESASGSDTKTKVLEQSAEQQTEQITDQRTKQETEQNTDQQTDRQQKNRDGKEKIAEPENAVGKETAEAKALSDAGVTAEQAEKVKSHVSQLEDGTIVYKVHFMYDSQRYSYQINAATGAVVDKNTETVTENEGAMSHRHGKNNERQNSAEPENVTGTDATAS